MGQVKPLPIAPTQFIKVQKYMEKCHVFQMCHLHHHLRKNNMENDEYNERETPQVSKIPPPPRKKRNLDETSRNNHNNESPRSFLI